MIVWGWVSVQVNPYMLNEMALLTFRSDPRAVRPPDPMLIYWGTRLEKLEEERKRDKAKKKGAQPGDAAPTTP